MFTGYVFFVTKILFVSLLIYLLACLIDLWVFFVVCSHCSSLISYIYCRYLFPVCSLYFHNCKSYLLINRGGLIFSDVSIINLCLVFKQSFPTLKSEEYLSISFCKCFKNLLLTYRVSVHLEFIFHTVSRHIFLVLFIWMTKIFF